jgi:hypothetical protein
MFRWFTPMSALGVTIGVRKFYETRCTAPQNIHLRRVRVLEVDQRVC